MGDPLPSGPPRRWSWLRCVAFRFALLYFVLYVLPFPLNLVPGNLGIGKAIELYTAQWDRLVRAVGHSVLSLDITVGELGSGDTTWNFAELFVMACLAAAGTLVWSLLARRRAPPRLVSQGFFIGVRYYLAVTLFSYGFAKIFKTQFPFPWPQRLMESFGDSSPMGLLWTFMGYSTPYNWFTGAMEALGGLLLVFRHTTTLGALVTVGTMGNVVVLNFCYDVPVKLYSMHLLAMAFGLLLPDLHRLLAVLVWNGDAPARRLAPFASVWANGVRCVLKLGLLGWLLYLQVTSGLASRKAIAEQFNPPLRGAYTVHGFEWDGEELPPLLTDAVRWHSLTLDFEGQATVHLMNDTLRMYELDVDADTETLVFKPMVFNASQPAGEFLLDYRQPSENRLTLEGDFEGHSLWVELERKDFELVKRGFHWVNEFPYNR